MRFDCDNCDVIIDSEASLKGSSPLMPRERGSERSSVIRLDYYLCASVCLSGSTLGRSFEFVSGAGYSLPTKLEIFAKRN